MFKVQRAVNIFTASRLLNGYLDLLASTRSCIPFRRTSSSVPMSTRRTTRSSARLAAAVATVEETTVATTTTVVASTARRSKASTEVTTKASPSATPSAATPPTKPLKASKTSTTKSSSKPTKPPASEPQIIHFPDIPSFDTWLSSSGSSTPSGIWLKISKKASGIPSITYLEAVDTALCHGWIDGMRRSLDASFFLQRFTPRRRKSLWSQRNVERVAEMIAQGRMREGGLAEVNAAKEDGRWEKAYAGPGKMETPRDFEEALAENEAARIMFESLTKSQRYPFLWRIETVKKAETRARKIEQFVELLAEGKTL